MPLGMMERIEIKNLLLASITLLAIFLVNATAKTALVQDVAAKVFATNSR
jgi:hypothetical protein